MTYARPVTDTVLDVRDLRTEFRTETGVVKAVNGVSFTLRPGERMAIVGESGSGKSAMAMSLIRLLAHPGHVAGGEVWLDGENLLKASERRLNEIRGARVGTIFQDPMSSLDPVMRVADQMVPPIARHLKLKEKAARDAAIGWLDKVGIPDAGRRIDAFPFEMSGGMRQRVMIAMALSCNPRLIIADEPTTALDVTIQAQIVELLKRLTAETGTAMLFITHDLGLVSRFARSVAVMYAGRIVETGPTAAVFGRPKHPYTQSLLRTVPRVSGGARERLAQIPGFPPDMRMPVAGCAFKERCPAAEARCAEAVPALAPRGPLHSAACLLPNGLGDLPEAPVAGPAQAQAEPPAWKSLPKQDVLEINNLTKHFVGSSLLPWVKPPVVKAVNGVSLRVRRGETLGIVGESGCGKSTVARLLLALDEPTSGDIFIAGTGQMVFQDPYSSFNPKMRVFDIIEEPLVVARRGNRAERAEAVRGLIRQVGLEESYLERYPNQLSGGQRQRIAVARALALNPSVVVADEPTSALDVSVRAQIINLLSDLKAELGVSFVFISHDLSTVRYISDWIAVMYLGEVVEYGPAEAVFSAPAHPYTRALLDAVPVLDPEAEADRTIQVIAGELPSPLAIPPGCAFASRCPKATALCRTDKPVLKSRAGDRLEACHHAG
ncbi:ABC transporter ATP-binding protein [Prosthecomicrobium sp. N25]|uniref:ABC transporter ATP-binding protein n=1 Tax=Prosthecomicrobium sp. N25 TaxID=3129254 RepID=UPI003078959E